MQSQCRDAVQDAPHVTVSAKLFAPEDIQTHGGWLVFLRILLLRAGLLSLVHFLASYFVSLPILSRSVIPCHCRQSRANRWAACRHMSAQSSRSSSPLPATPSQSQTCFSGSSDGPTSFISFEGRKNPTQVGWSPQVQHQVDETDLSTVCPFLLYLTTTNCLKALEDLDINDLEGHDFSAYQSLDRADGPTVSGPVTYTMRQPIPEPDPYYEDYYAAADEPPSHVEEQYEDEGSLSVDEFTVRFSLLRVPLVLTLGQNQLTASLSFNAIFTDANLFSLAQAYYLQPVLTAGPIPESEDEDQGPDVTIDADLSCEAVYTLDLQHQRSNTEEESQHQELPFLPPNLPGVGRLGDAPKAFGEEDTLPLAPGVPVPQHLGITDAAASRLINERRLN